MAITEHEFYESEKRRKETEQRILQRRRIEEIEGSIAELSKELARIRQLVQDEIFSRKVHRQAEKETLAKINKYLDQYV